MIYQNQPEKFNPRFRVVACYLQHDGNFLLLHRLNHKSQGGKWGLPAGKVEAGENEREAMSREMREETGLMVTPENFKYFTTIYVRYPEYDFIYSMFSLELDSLPAVQVNPNEHQNFRWMSRESALKIGLVDDLDECIKMFYQ